MATVLRAVQLKIESLTASNFPSSEVPPVYVTDAAVTSAAGAQVRPPYIVLVSTPGGEEYTFEDEGIEEWPFTLEIYYGGGDATNSGLTYCERALKAIRWNGLPKSQLGGLDYGTLPDLTEGTLIEVEPSSNGPRRKDGVGQDGKPVYSIAKDYVVRINP